MNPWRVQLLLMAADNNDDCACNDDEQYQVAFSPKLARRL